MDDKEIWEVMKDWQIKFMWQFITFMALLLFVLVVGKWNHTHFKSKNIPYLEPTAFIGNVKFSAKGFFKDGEYFPDFILRTYRLLKNFPFGGIFYYRQPILLLRDPELIQTITVKDFEHFTDHQNMFDKDVEPVWGKTLFSLTGKRWKDVRSAMSPAFTSNKMNTMFTLVNECCQQLVDFLEKCQQQPPCQGSDIQKDGDMLVLELRDLYTRYSNDVIATTAFGTGVDSLKQPTNEFYQMGQKVLQDKNTGWWRHLTAPAPENTACLNIMKKITIPKKVTEFFRSMVHTTISTREQEGIVRPDLIQLLLQAKEGAVKEDSDESSTSLELDNDDIAAQLLVFFLAGFETTSTLLCFASHQLAVYPEIQTRLQEEVDITLKENGGKFTYEAVNGMKYLDMVISETLRMFPPSVVGDRVCVNQYSLEINDLKLELEPGETLYIPIYALHHDPDYFPDPERFDPERFNDENKQNVNPLAYLPFGEGPRSCIGNRFALLQAKLALVHLLSRFNLKVVAKSPMPMKIIQVGYNNISVEGGFWFGLDLRRS